MRKVERKVGRDVSRDASYILVEAYAGWGLMLSVRDLIESRLLSIIALLVWS